MFINKAAIPTIERPKYPHVYIYIYIFICQASYFFFILIHSLIIPFLHLSPMFYSNLFSLTSYFSSFLFLFNVVFFFFLSLHTFVWFFFDLVTNGSSLWVSVCRGHIIYRAFVLLCYFLISIFIFFLKVKFRYFLLC